jgi:hypothetical protein
LTSFHIGQELSFPGWIDKLAGGEEPEPVLDYSVLGHNQRVHEVSLTTPGTEEVEEE